MDALDVLLVGHENARLIKEMEKVHSYASFSLEKIGNKDTDPSAIMISSTFDSSKTEEGLKRIYKVLDGLKTQPPSEKEMKIIKKKLLKTVSLISYPMWE